LLHIVNKSPFTHVNMKTCLTFAGKGDPILLIEDGIYAAAAGTAMEGMVKEAVASHPVYALDADLKARGVDKLLDGIKVCDYAGFVDLVAEHRPQSWL